MFELKDRTVLITGSSNGIGRYTAYAFAREGSRIVITYRNDKEGAEHTYAECLRLGMKEGVVTHLDLTDDRTIRECVQKVVERFGYVDILINNAGVASRKPLADQTFEEIENQIRTNLEGLIKFTRELLPYIREAIINVGSGAGKVGFENLTVYCATKFGLRGFTQALAREVKNLRVYAVNPGMTATRMTDYQGVHPEKVAQVILNTAKGLYNKPSGSDVDVWEYVP